MRIVSCAAAAVLLLAAACGGGKPEDAAHSWSATLQFAAEKWLDNSVPASFVVATCDSAEKALKKNPHGRKALGAAAKLRDAVKQGDRTTAQRVVAELRE